MRRWRKTGTVIALGGVVLAVLAVHTMDAPPVTPQRALPEQAPREAPQADQPETPPASSASVAQVTLPPPPRIRTPKTVRPLPPAARPTPEITKVTPLDAARPVKAPVPPRPKLTPQQPPQPSPAATRTITPLTAEAPAAAPDRVPDRFVKPAPVASRAAAPPSAPMPTSVTPASSGPPDSSAPSARTVTDVVPDDALRRDGRPLLRLLEHGEGPTVEIAWPGEAAARARLHRLFSQCYGMRIAVIDTRGRLFDGQSDPGQPWAINTDRFSGFIRQSMGRVPTDEHRAVQRIRVRHGLASGSAVRIFPRRADALLLGGLSRLVPDYRKAKRIQARYTLAANQIEINAIRVDGTPVAGAIDLTRAARRGCIL